jgi:hypothetical protein
MEGNFMKLQKYKILWFEDNKENVGLFEDDINIYLKDIHKREMEIKHLATYTDEMFDHIMDYEYNLIISDLNLLEDDKNGRVLIDLLRSHNIFTDVLLYSNYPNQLRDLTEGINYIDGIFRHATLKGLDEKIKDVIMYTLCREIYLLNRFEDYKSENIKE